jgi:hypothetical protein
MDYLVVAILFMVLGGAMATYFSKRSVAEVRQAAPANEARIRDLEKQIHIKERDFIEEKNIATISYHQELQKVREEMWKACEISVQEARVKIQAEAAIQQKLFSLSVRPYVQIIKNNGIIRDDYESKVGYKYQLHVNGIPAFQPHIIIEREEKFSEINDEKLSALTALAIKATSEVIGLYLTGVPSAAIKASSEAIIDHVTK